MSNTFWLDTYEFYCCVVNALVGHWILLCFFKDWWSCSGVYLNNLHINYIILSFAFKVSYFKINSTALLMHGPLLREHRSEPLLGNVWTLRFCILCLVFNLPVVLKQCSGQIFKVFLVAITNYQKMGALSVTIHFSWFWSLQPRSQQFCFLVRVTFPATNANSIHAFTW